MTKQENSAEIVTINLTTNHYEPSGETADIVIDSDNVHLVQGQALFVQAPNGSGYFINRTHDGYFTRRPGAKRNGVSLSSYLFGKTHMQRQAVNGVVDYDSYEREGFKSDKGKPAPIALYAKIKGKRATKVLYQDEYAQFVQNGGEAMQPKTKRSSIGRDYVDEHAAKIKARDAARGLRVGTEIKCPQCGKMFIKSGAQVFCSNTRNPGPNGETCKNKFYQELTYLRKRIDELNLNGSRDTSEPVQEPQPETPAVKHAENVSNTTTETSLPDRGNITITASNGKKIDMHVSSMATLAKSLNETQLRILFGNE